MDETKQNDKEDRRERRPFSIHTTDEGEVTDIICAAGHAYQVVHSQESAWLFYLRLTTIDGKYLGILRVVSWSGPSGYPDEPSNIKFYTGGAASLK